jgi:drug/metabolite transporter (DMT)-like permease
MVLFWAFNWIAVKVAFEHITAGDFAAVRWLLMEVIIVAYCLATKRSLRIEKGDLWPVLFVGFLNMGIYMVFFLLGLHETSATEGAIILATSPVITYYMAVAIRQERFNGIALMGGLIAFAGVVLVAQPSGAAGNRLLGDGLLGLSSVVMAWGAVLTRKLMNRYDPIRLFAISLPGALPVIVLFTLNAPHSDWAHVQPISLLMLLHSAALSGVAAYCLFYGGIKRIGAGGASLYQNAVAAVTPLIAWVYLGTSLNWLQAAGIASVLAGVTVATFARARADVAFTAQPAVSEP